MRAVARPRGKAGVTEAAHRAVAASVLRVLGERNGRDDHVFLGDLLEIAVTDDGRAALLAAIESHLQLVASLFSDRLTATAQAALSWVLSKLLARSKPDRDRAGR